MRDESIAKPFPDEWSGAEATRTPQGMIYRRLNADGSYTDGEKPFTRQLMPVQSGWRCLVCGRGNAPWLQTCPCITERPSQAGTGEHVHYEVK